MRIEKVSRSKLANWAALRLQLWPNCTLEELLHECEQLLDSTDAVCFIALDTEHQLQGFIEAAVYQDQSKPYCHVEGWYVAAAQRGQGIGQQLFAAVEQWALHRAVAWLTSDTTAQYPLSPKAHAQAGFKRVHQMTIFLRDLADHE